MAISVSALAQYPRFSIATDLGLVRNFGKQQQFTALNNTMHGDFHLSAGNGIRISFGYCSNGKFDNTVTALAKSSSISPQQQVYSNRGNMRFRQLTLGWKHYFIGEPISEKGWNLYGEAGFGLMMGRITNTPGRTIDTSRYTLPLQSGKANFKRLSYDLSIGWEKPVGADFFLYVEGRVYIPNTAYPSEYILVNEHAPLAGILCGGVRILF